jgi:hypothetical protein
MKHVKTFEGIMKRDEINIRLTPEEKARELISVFGDLADSAAAYLMRETSYIDGSTEDGNMTAFNRITYWSDVRMKILNISQKLNEIK